MTAPDINDLLIRLDGGISCLRRVAECMENSVDADVLNFLADHMAADVGVVQEWFDVAAKDSGPRAVT